MCVSTQLAVRRDERTYRQNSATLIRRLLLRCCFDAASTQSSLFPQYFSCSTPRRRRRGPLDVIFSTLLGLHEDRERRRRGEQGQQRRHPRTHRDSHYDPESPVHTLHSRPPHTHTDRTQHAYLTHAMCHSPLHSRVTDSDFPGNSPAPFLWPAFAAVVPA